MDPARQFFIDYGAFKSKTEREFDHLYDVISDLADLVNQLEDKENLKEDVDEFLSPDGAFQPNGRFRTGCGEELVWTHDGIACADDHGCVIHKPSNHSMRDFPTHWRGDRYMMERICPHGVGHPDPDHIAAVIKLRGLDYGMAEAVHGCDSCCKGAYGP